MTTQPDLPPWSPEDATAYLTDTCMPMLTAQPFAMPDPVELVHLSSHSAVFRWGEGARAVAIKLAQPNAPQDQPLSQEWRIMQAVFSAPNRQAATPVAEPLLFDAALGLLVMKWVSAPNVRSLIMHNRPFAQPGISRAAKWLSAFHACSPPQDHPFEADYFAADVTALADQVAGLPADICDRLQPALAVLPTLVGTLRDTSVATRIIHGDASPSNFLFDGRTLTALNLATAGRNDPLYDFALLMVMVMFDLTNQEGGQPEATLIEDVLRDVAGHLGPSAHARDITRAQFMVMRNTISIIARRHDNPGFATREDFSDSMETAMMFVDYFTDNDRTAVWFKRARGEAS